MKTLGSLLLAVWILCPTGTEAQTPRLVWDKPTDGEPVDFYSVYQTTPTNATPLKLGDTTNQSWLLQSFPTNAPVKWLVTAHRRGVEGPAAELDYELSVATPGPPTSLAAGRGNLLVNGGFEARTNGWVVMGNCGISASPGSVTPAEGKRCIVFNAGNAMPQGAVGQSIATVPGSRYALSFAAGIIGFVNKKTPQRLSVTVQGATNLISEVVALAPATRSKATFYPQSILFTADAQKTLIMFRDVSAPSEQVHLLLDDVKVITTP